MKLQTTHIKIQYCEGQLRYIKYKKVEIVRRIYTALRNHQWFTVPMRIQDEKILQLKNSFSIQYSAQYVLDDIDYEAQVFIQGNEDDTISFHFKGRANSDFQRNRIGICVHHPIKDCLGQSVLITNPNGDVEFASFPTHIEPDVLFQAIKKLCWKTGREVEAILEFEGDTFESEDQRNWTDNSFKTYSTPVVIPFPVLEHKGDTVEQKVTLSVNLKGVTEEEGFKEEDKTESRHLFPKIGYARSNTPMTKEYIVLLRQILFDHYRVEIDFGDDWIENLDQAYHEASLLNTRLELAVFFDDYIVEYEELKKRLTDQVRSLLLIPKNASLHGPSVLDYIIPKMKTEFPFIKIGSGTVGHFVDINRNRMLDHRLDFVSYAMTPQAHLTDHNVLVENLEAQQYPIATIRSFSDLPIYISPITLKSRDYPALTVDERQHTQFIADWTTICLKYLAGAEQITLFETIGNKGIINENGPSPVYHLLQKISKFKPKFIIKKEVKNELELDALTFENTDGERITLEVDFLNHNL